MYRRRFRVARRGALTPRKVLRLLKQHGFVVDHQTGSHVILIHPQAGQRVVVPVHARDVPRGTLMNILKAAGIE